MKCDKCGNDFSGYIYEKGETYNGIDEHHNPPKFLMRNWEGKFYNLCRGCHRKLHDEIIIILNKVAGTLKFNKSEHWVTKKMSPNQIEEARKIVYIFTEEWINEQEN